MSDPDNPKPNPKESIMKTKCACATCICKVDEKTAVKKDGKLYCSPHCADGHKTHKGCDHAGCKC